MASEYQLVAQLPGMTMQAVQRMSDGAFIPFDPRNRDYQLFWHGRQKATSLILHLHLL